VEFQRLIMADWSAANGPGPTRPAKDRCWVGRLDLTATEPVLVYCRTRAAALAQIMAWTGDAPGPVLIGFDFPFGYPSGCGLPGGRALCEFLAARIVDDDRGRNNRFAVAAALNGLLNPNGEGPFWGRPASLSVDGLSPFKPRPWPAHIPEFRTVERGLRGDGIQSVWKLAYPASVGSQVLMGMSAIGRLLARPEMADARLWPFETAWEAGLPAVTIAEIWPNLFYPGLRADPRVAKYKIRDAAQVAATLVALHDACLAGRIAGMLAAPAGLSGDQRLCVTMQEGWIVGA
jgi:molybdopterin molybdotransferase